MNGQAFEELYRSTAVAVLAYARRRTTSAAEAEDVAAETFAVAWRRRSELPTADALPWLYRVAHLVIANRQRGERRRAKLADRIAADPTVQPGVLADVATPYLESDRGMLSALSALSREDREALMLVGWEELGYRDAAAAMGVSEPSFARRLRRARGNLRRRLEEQEDERRLPLQGGGEEPV